MSGTWDYCRTSFLLDPLFWGYTDANCLDRNRTKWGILFLGLGLQHVIFLRSCLWPASEGTTWGQAMSDHHRYHRQNHNTILLILKRSTLTGVGWSPGQEIREPGFSQRLCSSWWAFRAVPRPWTCKVLLQRLIQEAETAFAYCSAKSLYRFFQCPVALLQPC